MEIHDWKEKSFRGNTQYSIKQNGSRYVLEATAKMSASALFKRISVNIQDTPFLNWAWQIKSALPPLNEQTKNGDDYSARIYVVVKTGIAPWSTFALNYVWSSNETPSDSWPNAFTRNAIMIPLRNRNDATDVWQTEKINVRADIKKYLGKEIDRITGIAIMTDTDNSGGLATAHYGDIFFSTR